MPNRISRCIDPYTHIEALAERVDDIVAATGSIDIYEEGVLVGAGNFTEVDFASAITTVTEASPGRALVTITGTAGAQNIFESIAVAAAGGTTGAAAGAACKADTTTDTWTLEAGNNITLANTSGTDTTRISVTGVTLLAFKTIVVAGQTDVVADAADDTLTLVAGTNMSITTIGDTITFEAAGGGGSGDAILQVANATTTITARATDWSTMGTGTAQPRNDDGTTDGAPVTVTSGFKLAIPSDATLVLDVSRTPPLVVSYEPFPDSSVNQYLKHETGTALWKTTHECS